MEPTNLLFMWEQDVEFISSFDTFLVLFCDQQFLASCLC
jgi:hypothetical protein